MGFGVSNIVEKVMNKIDDWTTEWAIIAINTFSSQQSIVQSGNSFKESLASHGFFNNYW